MSGYSKGYLTANLFLTISQKIKGTAWKITESVNIRWKVLINLCWLRYNLVLFFFPMMVTSEITNSGFLKFFFYKIRICRYFQLIVV